MQEYLVKVKVIEYDFEDNVTFRECTPLYR